MLTSFIVSDVLLIIILTIGLTALAIELIVPSFGFIGILGFYFILESFLAFRNFENLVWIILIAFSISGILTLTIARFLLKDIENNRLVLKKSMSSAKGTKFENMSNLVGKEGEVVKILRPSGEVLLEGKIYSAISSGDYISKGEKIIVEKIVRSQLYCKKVNI